MNSGERFLKEAREWIQRTNGRKVRAEISKGVFITGTAVVVEGLGGLEIKVKGPTGTLFTPLSGVTVVF